MGINVRDNDDIIDVNEIARKAGKCLVVLFLLGICLRFPTVWFKLGLMLVVLVWGTRWIFYSRKKKPIRQAPRRDLQKHQAKAPVKFAASADTDVIRQLIKLDAAGEFGKVKTLIQELDGKEFAEPEAEALAKLARNYFPVAIEKTDKGGRFKLMDSE